MAAGKWDRKSYEGTQLAGKTLGVVGVGNIGSRVARLGAAWGMNVAGVPHCSARWTLSRLTLVTWSEPVTLSCSRMEILMRM
jgi:phosphoglycerate dehydrogenase-like enzyme